MTMAMSRKHYERAAMVIRENDNGQGSEVAKGIARGLATMFKQDNGSFDRSRFMSACGFEGE
jgi:hypothetical protein